jgi:hypothetical protein
MAIGWFIAPYKRDTGARRPTRYVIVDDLTPQIRVGGGDWTEAEVLGGVAIVKVRASAATLNAIAALSGVTRIPVSQLGDPLSTLSTAQKNAIRTRVQALGYTLAELNAALPGDLGTHSIISDGPVLPVTPLSSIDAAVI